MDSLRQELQGALDLQSSEGKPKIHPYIEYLEESRPVTLLDPSDFLRLLLDIINFFRLIPITTTTATTISNHALDQNNNTIKSFISCLFSPPPGIRFLKYRGRDPDNRGLWHEAEDTVLLSLGLWLAMPSYFAKHFSGTRPIQWAYNNLQLSPPSRIMAHRDDLDITPAELLQGSCLLPSSDAQKFTSTTSLGANIGQTPFTLLDLLESTSIPTTSLNISTLNRLANVDIHWTNDVCRHMLLSEYQGRTVIEIFLHPAFLNSRHPAGVDQAFYDEVSRSYAGLFRLSQNLHKPHARRCLNLSVEWCWCSNCRTSRKLVTVLKEGLRGELRDVDEKSLTDWTPKVFPGLWQRILKLKEYQDTAKPWNFWVIFRNERDSVQYWTFVFAAFIIPLTIFQVLLGIAQVAGSFN